MKTKSLFWAVLLLNVAIVLGKGAYKGKHLYAMTDPQDTGGLIVQLPAKTVNIRRAIAFARRKEQPFLGKVDSAKQQIRFPNLPIDKYDILIITDDCIYEGIQLIPDSRKELVTAESQSIEKEVRKTEAFFEGKKIESTSVSSDFKAVAFVQQWRIGRALAESGAVLKGTIHSIDLFWFEKPAKVWQLTKRRQLYREEFDRKKPFAHHKMPKLSNIRVVRKTKTVAVSLPKVSANSQR